ncbi:hypothetical protein [Achromobacter xylosoxidans]
MSKIENTWRLAPVAAAQHELAEVRAALGFLPQGYTAMAGLERLADLLAAAEPSPTLPAVSTEQDAPITVTVDHDPRGVSVGVWQGSHCVYSGAHPLPASPGAPTVEKQRPARDWELTCHECDGSGHVYVKRQVAERKADIQEFKQECECCEGRGFVFAFQDIPGIEEYVKTCRPAPAAGDAQGLTLAQKYEDACIVANASAQDAARYRQLRKALTSYDTGWLDRIAAALEAMGLDPDEDKLPTPEQVDGAFDAAQRKGDA